jgi:hypothetical protein
MKEFIWELQWLLADLEFYKLVLEIFIELGLV